MSDSQSKQEDVALDNNPPNPPKNEIKLNSLTPSYYGEYNEILKNVFVGEEHKNDHNIAITADYGEGKSSVINSFLKENKEIKEKTITVSLSKYNYKNNDVKKQTCQIIIQMNIMVIIQYVNICILLKTGLKFKQLIKFFIKLILKIFIYLNIKLRKIYL